MQKRTKINILKIFNVLKTHKNMHIRGIARIAEMNPITVSTLVSRYKYFFEIENREIVPGFNARIVSLKDPNTTLEDVEKYLEIKKRIRGEQ